MACGEVVKVSAGASGVEGCRDAWLPDSGLLGRPLSRKRGLGGRVAVCWVKKGRSLPGENVWRGLVTV